MAKSVVVIDGVRSPYVKSGSLFNDVSVVDLGRIVTTEVLARAELDPSVIDEVIFGNISQPAEAANVSRIVALRSQIPRHVPAFTVQRNCASGMQAIASAYDRIQAGEGDVFLCGGIESMSNIPILFPKSFASKLSKLASAKSLPQKLMSFLGFRVSDFKPTIALLKGLTDPICGLNMGQTAEIIAREYRISRLEQDEFSLLSHQKTISAQEAGFFKNEIVPVYLDNKVVKEDVGPRKNQTLEALQRLRPFFDKKYGTITAGNSCPITDGGAAVVVTTEEKAIELGLKPKVRIVDYAFAGLDPARMGLGPAFSTAKLLKKTGLRISDIDLFEINEAFAAQVLANLKIFKDQELQKKLEFPVELSQISMDRLNVNGGAIALGHPVGSSGTRIVITLMNEMIRRNVKRGLASLCIGGGQGGSMILENCS
ncbi:MAG: thiolase family protein [Deltaproteobacteria bacterium]|nr:thiolase family protein [Deltaproteobacteria bacterium]